jgi:hypothetical protein
MLNLTYLDVINSNGGNDAPYPQHHLITLQLSAVRTPSSASRPAEKSHQILSDSEAQGQTPLGFLDFLLPITYTEVQGFPSKTLPLVAPAAPAIPPVVTIKRPIEIVRDFPHDFNARLSSHPEVLTMTKCRRCAINGNQREGGTLGVCKIHAKSKCRYFGCADRTLGEELCTAHAHQVELARWKARAEFRIIDPASALDSDAIRREKLSQARFLAHQAVEIFFSSLIELLQGVRRDKSTDEEERRAA